MNLKPWKLLDSSRPYKNVRIDHCELPNGREIEKMILEFGTWVTVVGITTRQEVILIRQYRHGVGKVIWELPAGLVDPGEAPLQAAARELLEETGYAGGSLVQIGALSPNPDNHTNTIYSFLALDIEKRSAQDLDLNEEIDVFPIPLNDVISMALNGDLPQAMHVSAIFLALSHLNRIIKQ